MKAATRDKYMEETDHTQFLKTLDDGALFSRGVSYQRNVYSLQRELEAAEEGLADAEFEARERHLRVQDWPEWASRT